MERPKRPTTGEFRGNLQTRDYILQLESYNKILEGRLDFNDGVLFKDRFGNKVRVDSPSAIAPEVDIYDHDNMICIESSDLDEFISALNKARDLINKHKK